MDEPEYAVTAATLQTVVDAGRHLEFVPWIRVESPALPFAVYLRIQADATGRHMVTAIQIGNDGEASREITSQMLRQIKLREVLAGIYKNYDPDAPPGWATPEVRMVRALSAASSAAGRVRQVRGPDDDKLRAFASSYLRELRAQPRRAMTIAAREHHISRATANRWAEMCREFGYLPSKDK